MTISIFAPISIGNISVGFDSLGLALSPINGELIGDIVSVKPSLVNDQKQTGDFTLQGLYADKLPQKKSENIVWQSRLYFENILKEKKHPIIPINITLEKNIPISSGLGSSACSIVAAFHALNAFYEEPFDQFELLHMMGQLEAKISGSLHYDNVAPCFLGGLQLMQNQQKKICLSLPIIENCYWVIAYPDIEVSTKKAREILPQKYSRKTMIEFAQNLAGFVDACYRQDQQQALSLITDVVAEPYRKILLPNFELAQEQLPRNGSLAFGISGSGPTVFCVTDNLNAAKNCAEWLTKNYLQSNSGFIHICQADVQGSRKI